VTFFAIIIGVVVGFIVYSSNIAAYKKAGAGQTYYIDTNTNIRFTRQLDNRGATRSRVDHGFYSGSVSAAGRSEAYPMPQSIKNTIEQAKDAAQSASSTTVGQSQPVQTRPPRPNAGFRPGMGQPANRPPRPTSGPANRPHRPGAPGPMNRKGR